ncbi:OmpA family protein [Sulfurospirillum arcachonense]|uniref:OmpA family protein n=1 Tax=Sulfurospirillum arcachonense TaxID=57666 RepID=UPI00046AAF93|nr:OmpA family protein [Sulfurospirillum arcachonense]
MKKILLISLTIAMFIFSGCSQKNPEVDATSNSSGVSTADKKADDISGMDTDKMASNGMSKNATAVEKAIAKLESNVNKIYFDFDKYDIRPDMKSKIEANAVLLTTMDAKNFSIKVEGNCDEWGTDEYNYALGLKRAKSVKESLAAYGVDKERIMVVSFGESNPTCKESNKACWNQNRRAEFKLLP